MNEPRVIESVTNECQSLGRAHESSSARAEQLIACLEGEIAKRDEELAACRVAVENCDVFRAELATIKEQEPTGWYTEDHLDDKSATTYSREVADRWVAKGWPVFPLYAAPVSEAKAQEPDCDRSACGDFSPGPCDNPDCSARRDRTVVAPAAPAADAWIPVSERLPDSGSTVIAYYLNSYGKGRTIRAQHVEAWTIEAEDVADVDTDCVEYSEQDDCYYLLQGWYECIDNWDEYYRVAVTEGPITHWMPLPAAPIKIEANRHDQ